MERTNYNSLDVSLPKPRQYLLENGNLPNFLPSPKIKIFENVSAEALPFLKTHTWSFKPEESQFLICDDSETTAHIHTKARNVIKNLKSTLAISESGLKGLKGNKNGAPNPLYTTELRHLKLKQKRADEEKKRAEQLEKIKFQKAALKQARRVIAEEDEAWERQKKEEVMFREALDKLKKRLQEEQSKQRTPYQEAMGLLAENHAKAPNSTADHIDGNNRTDNCIINEEVDASAKDHPDPTPSPVPEHPEEETPKVDTKAEDFFLGRSREEELASEYFYRWKQQVESSRELDSRAAIFFACKKMQACWLLWRERTKQNAAKRAEEEFRRKMLFSAAQMRKSSEHYHRSLLQKSWRRWKTFAKQSKTEKKIRQDVESRQEKIKVFLESMKQGKRREIPPERRRLLDRKSLEKTYAPQGIKKPFTVNGYANRLQAQKTVIKEQQVQIRQQQNIIDELRLSKVNTIHEKKQSQSTLEVNTLSSSDGSMELRRSCKSDPSLAHYVTAVPNKLPLFLLNMQQRAQERVERREALKALKLQRERERLGQKLEEEKEVKRREEEERRKRIEAKKEQKKLEKQREEERKAWEEKLKVLDAMAQAHYLRWLSISRGLKVFKVIVEINKQDKAKADAHFKLHLLQNCFHHWLTAVKIKSQTKAAEAEELCEYILMKRYLRVWKEARQEAIRKMQAAEDFNDMKLQTKAFHAWCTHVTITKVVSWRKEEVAQKHYDRTILHRSLQRWSKLPALLQEEKELEKKKQHWREKVRELLPDFQPPGSSSDDEAS